MLDDVASAPIWFPNNLTEDVNPSWSPDGQRIVFESERDGNKEIYVMDADGGNQIRLTRNDAVDSTATWSHDGSLIAFASNRNTGPPYNPYNLDITETGRISLRLLRREET